MSTMKLQNGKTALTTGTVSSPVYAFCHLDGSITITWKSGGTSVVPSTAGRKYDLEHVASVDVTTGTWSFS